jgi:hypothetical protein
MKTVARCLQQLACRTRPGPAMRTAKDVMVADISSTMCARHCGQRPATPLSRMSSYPPAHGPWSADGCSHLEVIGVPGYAHHGHVWSVDIDRTATPLGLACCAIFVTACGVVVCEQRACKGSERHRTKRSAASPLEVKQTAGGTHRWRRRHC